MARSRRPTVYLDANFLSALHFHGNNPFLMARQRASRDWWKWERNYFQILASNFVERELRSGSYPGQQEATAEVQRLCYLPFTQQVRALVGTYLQRGLVPESAAGDAIHLAFATCHRVDYLLTWNYAHLANLEVARRLKELNDQWNLRSPFLVTPENIPRKSLGQDPRRTDES